MISVRCNLCGRDDWTVRYPSTLNNDDELEADVFRCTFSGYGHHPQIVECNHCHLVYANPRWDPQKLVDTYTAVEDDTYIQERDGRELTFKKHLAALEQYTGPANGRSLLDVGAYIGVFVEIAAAAGWDSWGLEPSDWAVAEAQDRGLQFIQGTLSTGNLGGNKFDVITMWDVIEHLYDPAADIALSREYLKPGGWLVLHTMDVDSLTSRLMGKRWPWYMDMHVYYFSQKTLAQMLVDNGFSVVWSGPQSRYLRLGYLATRLGGVSDNLGKVAQGIISMLRLSEVAIPVNFGDLFTIYARRL